MVSRKITEGERALSVLVKNGFANRDDSDIINAVYIAKKLGKIKVPFKHNEFKTRGPLGVESSEVRCFLADYDKSELLEIADEHPETEELKLSEVAEYLSKLNSKKLGVTAQFLYNKSIGQNGSVHLYKEEADLAKKLINVIKADLA